MNLSLISDFFRPGRRTGAGGEGRHRQEAEDSLAFAGLPALVVLPAPNPSDFPTRNQNLNPKATLKSQSPVVFGPSSKAPSV